tara:strand:+ start:252 stop:1079 length:828 start_codon:yes stop_codon:yes gene_type:complete
MFNLDLLYTIREKIPKNIRRILPKIIRRQIDKKFFKYYFLKTNLRNLPHFNYPEKGNLEYQKKLIEQFNFLKKQTSFMTCPYLMELLSTKFDTDKIFNILDIGGEKIDFYLSLKKKFKNAKYFLYNQKSMTDPLYKIKSEFDYKDFHIIDEFNKISNKNYDFVNLGSCIQYFDNYEEVLKKITKNSKYVFFSGTHLYDSSEKIFKKKIVVKQVNVLPQINYLFFFNRNNFFKTFLEKKYDLVFEKKNLTDEVNYDNFKNFLKNIQYSDFLFSKKL